MVRNVKINSFLANLNLPSITEEQQRSLDDPISVNEINELNLKLANGKAPGLDCFTSVVFFKRMCMKSASLIRSV